MRRARLCATSLLAAFLLAGCASGSGGGGNLSGSVLTREDLADSNRQNLFDVLKNHPSLEVVGSPGRRILSLGTRSDGVEPISGRRLPILLVLDGTRMTSGIPDVLRDLELTSVQRVEILRPAEAGSRYGTGDHSGVLIVKTRR